MPNKIYLATGIHVLLVTHHTSTAKKYLHARAATNATFMGGWVNPTLYNTNHLTSLETTDISSTFAALCSELICLRIIYRYFLGYYQINNNKAIKCRCDSLE